MGATVNELTVISLRVGAGAKVSKGQKIAELESDKSVFEFECPCDGTLRTVVPKAGQVLPSGALFLQIETSDATLKHLQASVPAVAPSAPASTSQPSAQIWTPRAQKLAQEAGLDPGKITDITGTGPGGRISGDDLIRYLAKKKSG